MAAYLDRRLAEKIETAGQAGLVEAVIVVKEADGPTMEDGGLTQAVIEAAAGRAGILPASVRYFPRANAAVIQASASLLREILQDERLAAASASDIDIF